MVVRDVRLVGQGTASRFEAVITAESTLRREFLIRFDLHAEADPLEASGDPWLAALLVPAMFAGETLEILAPVSRRLTRTVAEIQSILHSWYPTRLNRIDVIAPQVVPTALPDETGATAAFFSGGVDSWFSLLNHRQAVSALVTVKGFDIPYTDQTVWQGLLRAHQQIAANSGTELITVETDLRDHLDPGLGCFRKRDTGDFWGECLHGACLAAVGLLLPKRFAQVVIPSSWAYTRLRPWGSHPLLDSLWSNGRIEFLHDGAHATRLDKIRAVSQVEAALSNLRVCPAYSPGRYNCGECEKCRRTMLALRLFGALDRCPTFHRSLDLRAYELEPPQPYLRPLYREMLTEAVARGDEELSHTLRLLAGDRWSARRAWHRWSRRMRRSAAKRWNRWRLLAPRTTGRENIAYEP